MIDCYHPVCRLFACSNCSNTSSLSDMIKVGRRGSINGWITVEGRQALTTLATLASHRTS